MSEHERLREWAGAYVLGALEPDERREFELHLETCDACRSETASLAPITPILGRIEPEELEPVPPAVADRAVSAVGDEWRRLRASRSRWRALAAVAVTAMVAVIVWPSSATDDEGIALPVSSEVVVSGQILLETRGWGTNVVLSLEGVPDRDRYVAWAVGRGGDRQPVATWGPTESGNMRLIGAAAFQRDDVSRIEVTSEDPTEILATAVMTAGG